MIRPAPIVIGVGEVQRRKAAIGIFLVDRFYQKRSASLLKTDTASRYRVSAGPLVRKIKIHILSDNFIAGARHSRRPKLNKVLYLLCGRHFASVVLIQFARESELNLFFLHGQLITMLFKEGNKYQQKKYFIGIRIMHVGPYVLKILQWII